MNSLLEFAVAVAAASAAMELKSNSSGATKPSSSLLSDSDSYVAAIAVCDVDGKVFVFSKRDLDRMLATLGGSGFLGDDVDVFTVFGGGLYFRYSFERSVDTDLRLVAFPFFDFLSK